LINNTLPSYSRATNRINADLPEVATIDMGQTSPGIDLQNDTSILKTAFSSASLSICPIDSSQKKIWQVFAFSIFLVSVPVFVEAPLVRSLPWLSVALTGFWVWLSFQLMARPATHVWGDLLFGFSWSWLAGALYWGWLRWEPLYHLPVESIGLPLALWCLWRNWGKVGNWFYFGSLLGTVLTDVYFYLVDLMPYWRQIMQVEAEQAPQVLRGALMQVQTPWGESWALTLGVVLLTLGILPLIKQENHWYAFSGAVLSTILVDTLFLVAAILA
jgi:Protein of unknown function (DUF3120)